MDPLSVILGLSALAGVISLLAIFVWWYINRANQSEINTTIKTFDSAKTTNARYQVLDKMYLQYIEENLKRSKSVFRLTLIMILTGFMLIFIGVGFAFGLTLQNPQTAVATDGTGVSVVAASLSVLAGLVTNFIGTIILAVFRSSNRQNMVYFQSVGESLERQAAFDILNRIEEQSGAADAREAQLEVMRLVFKENLAATVDLKDEM